MSDQEKKRSKKYKRVREKFEELPLEEKATFLVEAMFTTLTKGVEQAGKAFSEELNSLFDQARERAERGGGEADEEAVDAEDETGDHSGEGEAAESSAETAGEEARDESAEEKS